MSIPGSANILLLASAAAYEIKRSLRFNSSDSAYLSRTPASAGNRRIWTWAAWVKLATLSAGQNVIFSATDGTTPFAISAQSSGRLLFGNLSFAWKETTAVFRDYSAWYHFCVAVDTNQSLNANRLRLYVNGVEQTAFSTNRDLYLNTDLAINGQFAHEIGRYSAGSNQYFNGYLADIHFIDGQALDPTSFTEVDATTGQLVPIEYTGTYGTNGFHLPFSDNSTAAALGTDTSGNGNDWTTHNVSVELGGPTSVAAATGALPIYNTTDTYGTVKGTGVRSDANASYLSLCLPLEGSNGSTTFTDESPTGRTSSTKTFTPSGNAQISTSQSYFYGSSCYLDGTGDYLTSSATGTDMTVGTGAFTLEFWGYFNSFSGSPVVLSAGTGGFSLGVNSSGQVFMYRNGPGGWGGTWTAQTLSTSTWYHIAAVTSSGSGGVWTVYIDGISQGTQSGWSGEGTTSPLYIGGYGNGVGTQLPNGYFSDIRIYKGIAKYTSNFNPPSATLNPTVAAGNDSLVDTPTNYGTDTGAGGEVRGNYCTLNPLFGDSVAIKNGNLDYDGTVDASLTGTRASVAVSSGKWYYEVTLSSPRAFTCGWANASDLSADPTIRYAIGCRAFNNDYRITVDATAYDPGDTGSANDVIGVAFDADQEKAWFAINGVWKGSTSQDPATDTGGYTGSTMVGPYIPYVSRDSRTHNPVGSLNFGQRQWAYAAPAGFKALCTTNLPAPVVAKPSEVMDVALWTGDGNDNRVITTNFSPEFLWLKRRDTSSAQRLTDVVRGDGKILYSDSTDAETTETTTIKSLGSTGFTLGTSVGVNASGGSYVGWHWDAGSSTVSNTDGSITSTVRANPSAGFSIVTWTGTGSDGATVGHGLGAAPSFVIIKQRIAGPGADLYNWNSYHSSLGATKYIALNKTDAAGTAPIFNDTAPTSTVFSLGSSTGSWNDVNNASGVTYVAYCFAPVVGYSSFGSYTGNGSADGPFVYTGFRPRWVLIKQTNVARSWYIFDAARNTYNPLTSQLYPNLSDPEATNSLYAQDFVANGWKIRSAGNDYNDSGGTYIYAAFAEQPFKTSRGR